MKTTNPYFTITLSALGGFAAAILMMATGCSSTPTSLDRAVANVQTNYVPTLALQTNLVTVVQTNVVVQTLTVTNSVGIPVPLYQTNVVTVTNTSPVVSLVTNQVPTYTLTPNATATGVAGVVGSVTNAFLPGTGGLITSGLLAALSIFLGYRNRQMNGQNDVLSQVSGTLAQTIETARELLPKAQQDAFTTWMIKNQASAGVIQQVAQIVKDSTNNVQAQAAANEIIALMTPPPTGPAPTAPAKV